MAIWGVKDVQDYLGASRADAIRILNMKTCPVMHRRRNQHYKVYSEDFKAWVNAGGLQSRR